MGSIAEIQNFVELSEQLMRHLYGDMWQIRDDLSEVENNYIRSLRTVQRIKNFTNE